MFVKDNLIRLITEDGDAEIRIVIEDELDSVVQIAATDNENVGNYVDANDYELVAESLEQYSPIPMPTFEPSHSVDQIHEELELLMVQLVQYYQASDVSGTLHMKIEAVSGGSDDNLTVEYTASIGYGNNVTTRRLDDSVRIAIDRTKENDSLKPIEIAFKGRDAA
tara:strand:- start:51 stop:548 length:498 start_codon:yes stop_codon:yes gene_type:complete